MTESEAPSQPAAGENVPQNEAGSVNHVSDAGSGSRSESHSDRGSAKQSLAASVALVFLFTWIATRFRGVPFLNDFIALVVALVFLGVALWRIGRREDHLREHGIWLGGLFSLQSHDDNPGPLGLYDLGRLIKRGSLPALRELLVAIAVAAVIFPPFLFAFRFYNHAPGFPELVFPEGFASLALGQVLVIALPEEVFFRGYLQTRLEGLLPHSREKRFGVAGWTAIVLQSVLFALIHFLVDLNPARLAVFFPGLLFGVLRSVRGGVGAGIWFHAMCNLYSELLFRGYGL